MLLIVLLGSILVVGLMGLVQIVRAHRVAETLRNMWVLARGLFAFGVRPNVQVSLDNPYSLKLPFGVAVAMATIISFCAVRLVA